MKPFMEENLADEHRKDIMREMNDIHMQEEALRSRDHRPNLFTRTMQSFGQWLIARGEGLVKRYEIPANRTSSSKHRYAH